tara:strand:- start:21 stop:1043 length:1023 start_codon:yes stop_codon:yes gene_type:complete
MKKRILLSYGTRPELIKLFKIQKLLNCDTLFSGQHYSLIKEYQGLIGKPTHTLSGVDLSNCTLDQKVAILLPKIGEVVTLYDGVIVQGDTLTTYVTALSAFQQHKKIFYVESGLRTGDLLAPFPEEGYRQMISRIASVNFAPTPLAESNLKKECVPGEVLITGNTVVDAVKDFNFTIKDEKVILVTIHRRENIDRLEKIFYSLNECAIRNPALQFIFPMHPNPLIHEKKYLLSAKNFKIIDPISYANLLEILSRCSLVITDSGGIQEETASFGKRCIVCRDKTERPEGVSAGLAFLCGDSPSEIFSEIVSMKPWKGTNPYGDGLASEKICQSISESWGVN